MDVICLFCDQVEERGCNWVSCSGEVLYPIRLELVNVLDLVNRFEAPGYDVNFM